MLGSINIENHLFIESFLTDTHPHRLTIISTYLLDSSLVMLKEGDYTEIYPGSDMWEQSTNGRLTWQGHEFLDAARNEDRWNQAKKTISEKGGSLTFRHI